VPLTNELASLAAITAFPCVAAVQAMPIAVIAAPPVSDSASGATVAPGSGLIQTVKKRAYTRARTAPQADDAFSETALLISVEVLTTPL
jgi:hypothetical protein